MLRWFPFWPIAVIHACPPLGTGRKFLAFAGNTRRAGDFTGGPPITIPIGTGGPGGS